MAFNSPKLAMAELRHSSSLGSRASSSPKKRDDDSSSTNSPLIISENQLDDDDDDDNRHFSRDRDRFYSSVSWWYQSKISIPILSLLILLGFVSIPLVWNHLNAPYLCKKDGIVLRCPRVKEAPSLWENPYSATTSWKSCAERRDGVFSDVEIQCGGLGHLDLGLEAVGHHVGMKGKEQLVSMMVKAEEEGEWTRTDYVQEAAWKWDLPPENETTGYVLIHAEGGLNQQRIAICNAVAVAKIMNATLILPLLKQDQIWKDQTKFEDIFDVDHFIDYLKDDVRIVRDIPEWFPDKAELFTSIKRTVKNIPKYAPAQFYIDNVLPRIREKKIMALKPFVDRLGYDNVPPEINRLRCRVNYHALKFLPEIEQMADQLASRMRNRTGSSNPYMALHLRFEKGMVGLSFCDFVGTREEKAIMAEYRKKEWPRRYKVNNCGMSTAVLLIETSTLNLIRISLCFAFLMALFCKWGMQNGSHLWQLALQKRKEGRCPLEPGEVAVILRAMGYPKETQIYVASGQVYGGQNRMAPLRTMFPNLVTKEELTSKEELDGFRKHVTSLAALDFLVCLKSDVFVMTHGGNFAKLIIGARRYMGHRLKSIKPDKGLMSKSFGDPYMGWATFVEDVVVTHQTRTGLPEETFPNYDLWENPLTPCMCKA
ncbi:hypothetical protein IFM89_036135 [Coptis chinensis]|uniref:O-fucosyltransferase family protein n=2 Tax=Magnoliopsida TaxID=3398 RepID=A0A835HQ46_9MAGN|nr:hypothetical protein IFM89_036135 [Coptis chinensis]